MAPKPVCVAGPTETPPPPFAGRVWFPNLTTLDLKRPPVFSVVKIRKNKLFHGNFKAYNFWLHMYPFKINIKRAISEKPLQKAYIIMYIENQASRQSPPHHSALSVNLLRFGVNSGKRGGGPTASEVTWHRLSQYTWNTHLFSEHSRQAH